MAIGARISSENLSGKTATVTFTPYTGNTSGTTVNLGTKTIPFNNIAAHPYGDYAIYLAEYDYTYTLNIPEPANNPQTFVFTDRMVGSNNYGAALLNFSDLTAEIIDLDVDSDYWYNDNVYPLQNSGYMYEFGGNDNNDERLVIFTDANGLEIGRYSGTTGSWDSNALSGGIVSFEDGDNGILKYSNGTSVFTYTWDSQTHYIDIENDWYQETSDNTFIIKKYEEGSWDYNGDGESYLVNGNDGTTTLFKSWTDGTYVRHKMQPNTDFIVVETQNQLDNYRYTKLEICDTSGTTLETVWLTGATYTSRSDEFLGTNKYCAVYYNGDENAVDYKIIHYNGDTETLTQTSHVRGANYTTINIQGDNDFWSNNSTINGGVAITLYNSIGYNSIGEEVSYCDIVYMLKNQTSFSTYVVADDTIVKVDTSGQLSNIYRTPISTGDFFEILTISSTGGTITTTSVPISGINSVNNDWLGDKTIYNILSNDANDIDSLLVNVNGSVMDTLSRTLSNSYNYSMNSIGQLGYLRLYLNGGDESYYVYSGSTGFTSTSTYDDTRTPSTMYRDTFLDPEVMVLYSEGGNGNNGFRVLTSTGITSQLQFPQTNGRYISLGETKFMLVHNDYFTDAVVISLYNFSGQLLNSYTTAYNGWNDTYGIGDRFVVVFNGNTGREYFLVSEEKITSVVLDNHDSERAPNDYNWWND